MLMFRFFLCLFRILDINAEKSKSSYLLLFRSVKESKSVSGNSGSKSSNSILEVLVFEGLSKVNLFELIVSK